MGEGRFMAVGGDGSVDRTKTHVTERPATPLVGIAGQFLSRQCSIGFKNGALGTEDVTPGMMEILKRSFAYIGAFLDRLNRAQSDARARHSTSMQPLLPRQETPQNQPVFRTNKTINAED